MTKKFETDSPSFAEIESHRTPRTRTEWIPIDSGLIAQIEALERELTAAQRVDATENRVPEAPRVAAKLDKLRDEAEQAAVEFTMQALPRKRYRKLIEAHPAPKEKDGAPKARWNEDTFAPALISACCTKPTGVDGQVIWDEWDDGMAYTLFAMAVSVNEEPPRVPFSVSSTAQTNDSETNSTSAASED